MEKSKSIFQKQSIVVISAVLCCLLWGSAIPGIKTGYRLFEITSGEPATHILFAGLRFTLSGIMVIIAGSIMQKTVLKPSKSAIPKVINLSLVQTALQYVFFYIGLANTTGVKSSIINAVNVFFAIIISCLIFKLEKLNLQKIAGCIVGFAGIIIINLGGEFDAGFTLLGEGFMILTAVASAFSTAMIRIYGQTENPVMLSGYQFFLGGVFMVIAGLCFGGTIHTVTVQGITLLLYLAFVSAGGYTL